VIDMVQYSDEVAFLVAHTGPLDGQRWSLNESILIGREATCDITIADRQVSRRHARLRISSEGILLEDMESKNGTHHNGKLIIEPTLLKDGDVIQVALAQQFFFLSSDATIPLDDREFDHQSIQPFSQPIEKINRQEVRRLHLEKRSRRVWLNLNTEGEEFIQKEVIPPLSVSQFRLLERLYENQDRVVPRQELITAIWGENQAVDVSVQALDALVRRLRDRLANIDNTHTYIQTIRGHGLRLINPLLVENSSL
jgi:pSer/pThr/pTyr-binding forkhead associated (FHA) protein